MYGALEAHCRRRDVEVFASRDRELVRCAVGVQTWRYLPQGPWRSGEVPQACRRGGVEVWRCAAGV